MDDSHEMLVRHIGLRLAAAQAENDLMKETIAILNNKLEITQSERDGLSSERVALFAERAALFAERAALFSERDALYSERDALSIGHRRYVQMARFIPLSIRQFILKSIRMLRILQHKLI